MEIVETPIFTRRVANAMTEEEYRSAQIYLVARPDAGALIPGGGGVRKLRWLASGRGKSGGSRIIYYWARADETLLMLYVYEKNESEDLTRDQLKALRSYVESEYP